MAQDRAAGTYFDGLTARPHPVTIELSEHTLRIEGPGLHEAWSLIDVVSFEAPEPYLRLGRPHEAARVEIRDATFGARFRAVVPDIDRRRPAGEGGGRTKLVLWSVAAGVSVLLTAIFGMPLAATVLAPMVPPAVEARLARAVDEQVVEILKAPVECNDPAARAVLDKLVARMVAGADLPFKPVLSVRKHDTANALTLPGGRVIVLSDLIAQSRTPDEFAGVLAHELGHVAHRHPMRSLIAASGTSFLLSLILGDLTGSTIVVAVGQAAISAGHSRDAEREADAYGVAMMRNAGGDPAALATILERIDKEHDEEKATAFLRSHPFTKERAATIRAAAGPDQGRHILSDQDWTVLRRICPASPTDGDKKAKPAPSR